MLKKTVKHIHRWRIVFLLLFSTVFLSYLGLNPIDVGKYYGASFGSAVGMSTSVPENPFNKLALQLKEKEELLNNRELELDQREKEIMKNGFGVNSLSYLMGVGIVLLFFLILLNYYLDFRRRRKE